MYSSATDIHLFGVQKSRIANAYDEKQDRAEHGAHE
jgi:hypothetical protein